MRVVSVALFAACLTSAFGQLSGEEKYVQLALSDLRQEKEIMLSLDGVDQFGPRKTALYSNAFFLWDPLNPNAFAKAEINDYVNNAHTTRLVADGTTLWSYSFPRNTYSSFRYGSYAGAEPEGFRTNMLQELTASSQSSTVFLARTLRETFSGTNAQYTGWFPGAAITVVGKGSSMTDPVDPNRVYVGDDFNIYIVYTYTPRQKRSAAFHIVRGDLTQPWALSEIYYADQLQINPSTSRLVEWVITAYVGALPSSTNFIFVPPAAARATANVKGQGG
ncbi:MAG: hypothetical protein ACHQ50_11675 [Fimbriimonadales bacterium]